IREKLVHDLEQIVQLKGEFILSPEAEQMYRNWYEEQDINARQGKFPVSDPRFAGYCERRPVHLKKLCMVLNASHSNQKMITADDFQRALEIMQAAEMKMGKTFGGLGQNKYGVA